ncbi:MAG TPA: hypothetical protein VE466_10490 [Acidimicrobiales bacterium]|jgi:hypothetical protein|nr:hypothetical protein [Acidimicrobiales bacterium]
MTTQPTADASSEIARLRSERDELRAEVETLRRRARQRGWWRRMTVVALVVLACVVLTAAVVGLWARRNFLDTDRFVDRTGPLIEEPSVQQALTNRLTEQLMTVVDPQALFTEVLPERGRLLAVPLASAVEGFVRDRVESFVGTDQFERLWVGAVRVAHEAAVRVLHGESEAVVTEDGQVTLNLVPVANAVLQRISAASPEILGRDVDLPDVTVDDIPDVAIARLEDALGVDLGDDFGQVTVYDDGKLEAVQDSVNLFDRLVVWLLPLGVVLAGVALWLSTRRRRTLLQLSAGLALGMVLIRRVGFRLQDEVASLPPTAEGRRAGAEAVEQFLQPLTTFAAWTLAVVGVVAAVAVLTGDYPWVVSLRRLVGELRERLVATTGERARDEATVAWIGDHRDVLLIGGVVVGLVLLWIADLSWAGLLLVLGLVAAFEVVVYRIAARPAAPPPAS